MLGVFLSVLAAAIEKLDGNDEEDAEGRRHESEK